MTAPRIVPPSPAPAARRALARLAIDLRRLLEDDARRQRPDRPVEEQRDLALDWLIRLVAIRSAAERGLLDQDETASLEACPGDGRPGRRAMVTDGAALRMAWATLAADAGLDQPQSGADAWPSLTTLNAVAVLLDGTGRPPGGLAGDDLLGWVYQYALAPERQAAGKRSPTATVHEQAAGVAAATALYTERYMAEYLLQNTLGALWLDLAPESRLPERWPYFPGECGRRPRRPEHPVREITVLDPACGSGHLLLRAFDLLAEMYREEGREAPADVPRLILERNLAGLDIDPRAVAVARLALALKARAAGLGGPPARTRLYVPSGEHPAATEDPAGLLLGALVDPQADRPHGPGRFRPGSARGEARTAPGDPAAPASPHPVADLLASQFDVVVMNPPYLGLRRMPPALRAALARAYPDATADLCVAFVERGRRFVAPGGYLGVVSPQAWLTARGATPLRTRLAQGAPRTAVALGQRRFAEAALLYVGLFTWQNTTADGRAYRVGRLPAGANGEVGLRDLVARRALAPWEVDRLRSLPGVPFLPEAPPGLLRALGTSPDPRQRSGRQPDAPPRSSPAAEAGADLPGLRLRDAFRFRDGYWGGLNQRDVRYQWELPRDRLGLARVVSTGKGYARWWRPSQHVLLAHGPLPDGPRWEYGRVAGGRLSARWEDGPGSHLAGAVGLYPLPETDAPTRLLAGAVLNSRLGTAFLRTLTSGLNFNPGYCGRVPLPRVDRGCEAADLAGLCLDLARRLWAPCPPASLADVRPRENHALAAWLLAAEAVLDTRLVAAFGLSAADQALLDATIEPPVGRLPLLRGHDRPPPAPADLLALTRVAAEIDRLPRVDLDAASIRQRLRAWRNGQRVEPSARPATGAAVILPAETDLEAWSRALGLHPFSVLALLDQVAAEDGSAGASDRRRNAVEAVSATVLHLLGADWLSPAWPAPAEAVRADAASSGILPLTRVGERPTAADLVRRHWQADLGEAGATRALDELRQATGRDLDDWLRTRFFAEHVRQFRRRPIVWHLASPRRTFETLVLYHRLDAALLETLRAEYARPLAAALEAERGHASTALEQQIEDVRDFCQRLERIERGDGLAFRIRCPWKDELVSGRPGPYAPDPDDGVQVNLRPFQEAGLLPSRPIVPR